jgi:O-antigen/teichoic acid export membrane protein
MRSVEDIYTSSLAGLQRQVEQNVVTSIMATVQAGGAVAILAWVSCTITAFFLWQGLISLITVVLFSGVVYHALPAATRPARASWTALRGIWQFAAGMMALTCLSLFLTQVDKILLTRLLSLRNFGYYTLAGVIASGLNALTGAIAAAFYPRFTALATAREHAAFRAAYHQGAQLVTVLTGAAAVVLMVFGDRVMLLWTADPALAQRVAPLLTVMALGTLLSGLMWIPSQMMLAHGWTTLAIKANTIVVCVLVPAILWVVPRYGAIGAAWVWVLLNTFYLIFTISLMHRRLLPAEKWLWYREDVVTPLVAATGVALLCRWLVPNQLSRLGELSALFISSVCVLLGSALAAPAVRDQLTKHLSRTLKPIAATTE